MSNDGREAFASGSVTKAVTFHRQIKLELLVWYGMVWYQVSRLLFFLDVVFLKNQKSQNQLS